MPYTAKGLIPSEDMAQLERTMAQGFCNGATGLEIIDDARLHELVPAVNGKFALFSSRSGILDPFLFTIGLAENAAENGVRYYLEHDVERIERKEGRYLITSGDDTFSAEWVINAAGLGAKRISDMLGITGYRVIGSKGNYLILDKRLGPLLPMPVRISLPPPDTASRQARLTTTKRSSSRSRT